MSTEAPGKESSIGPRLIGEVSIASAEARILEEGSLLLPPPIEPKPAPAYTRALDEPFVDHVPGRISITAAMLLVMVLVSMEQTITSTAMPSIIGDLHGLEHYSWVASIYLLACTVSMPLYGRMADAIGRKRVVLVAIAIFCGSSLLASTAHSMVQLIIFRGMQGLGAGGVMPVVLTIIGDIFTLEERAKIQGLFSAVWGMSSLAGPALGALLVKTLGWRSVFWVNLPIGLVGLLLIAWKYHERREEHEMDLDFPGVAAIAIASMAVLSLVSGLGPNGWSGAMCGVLAVAGVAAVAFFVRHERRAKHPILPTQVVMQRAVGPSIVASCLFGAGFLSLDTFVPLYIQGARGGDATAAAGVVTPVMLTWAISGTIAAPLIVKWGYRRTTMLGGLLIFIGFLGLVICTIMQAPHSAMTATLAITGLGFGPVSMSVLISAQEAVTYQHRGVVTSAISFFRTMGGAVGIGMLGAMFNIVTARQTRSLAARGVHPADLLDPAKRRLIPPALLAQGQHMIGAGLLWVFVAMLASVAVLIAVTRLMPGGAPTRKISASEAMEM